MERLNQEYLKYYTTLRSTYETRIQPLELIAEEECRRFARNSLSLYTHTTSKWKRRPVTLTIIRSDLHTACKNGIPYVEYKLNTYYYQAWDGDTINLYTGVYLMQPEHLHIPGGPSIVSLLRKEGYTVTFTEQTSTTGLLRIEVS